MPVLITKGFPLLLALFFGYNVLSFPSWFKDDEVPDINVTITRHYGSTYYGKTDIDGEECPTIIRFSEMEISKKVTKKTTKKEDNKIDEYEEVITHNPKAEQKKPGFGKIHVTFKRDGKKMEIEITRDTDLEDLDTDTTAVLYRLLKEVDQYNKSHGIVGKAADVCNGTLGFMKRLPIVRKFF